MEKKRTVKRAWEGHVGGVSILNKDGSLREFPGSPVVRTPSFHCREHGVDS